MSDATDEPLGSRTRRILEERAERMAPITYRGLARALRLEPPNTIQQVTRILERLMHEDAGNHRPFIAALVVSRARQGLPAPGFFDCARQLGRFQGDPSGAEAESFYRSELEAAIRCWGAAGGKPPEARRGAE